MSGISTNVGPLAQYLDVAGLRHRVIAQNVANVNTPNYRALEVSFEDQLRRQLELGMPDQAEAVLAKVIEAKGGVTREDGNNVDIDREMGNLSKNKLLYQTVAHVLAMKLSAMRSAISGR